MKIISKYKDYYDYLAGMWGVDPLLVLKRDNPKHVPYLGRFHRYMRFHICGQVLDGIYLNEEFYYGKDILKLPNSHEGEDGYIRLSFAEDRHVYKYVFRPELTPYGEVPVKFRAHKSPTGTSPNDKTGCPIILEDDIRYPNLSEYKVNRAIPPEQMWLMLSQWLGQRNTPEFQDTMTNDEKITSHGFDTKTSFRGKQK